MHLEGFKKFRIGSYPHAKPCQFDLFFIFNSYLPDDRYMILLHGEIYSRNAFKLDLQIHRRIG